MKKRRVWIAAAMILAAAVSLRAYAADCYPAGTEALAAMESGLGVTVTETGNLTVFAPENPAAGFVFYPGGKVEHRAYAPLMQALAQEDVLCVLVKMPLNLAVLNADAAEGILKQYPRIDAWYIGGHSLGGSMAAAWASENAQDVEGLALLAAYSTADLKETDLEVLSIYGSEDGVLNMENYARYRPNLPGDTTEVIIYGGNHARFGCYGPQEGDGEAYVSWEEQQAATVRSLLELIYN